MLWIQKHAPSSSASLCVAPKKVKEVAQWMVQKSECKLLLLVGSPGVGKSAMVHCIAAEQGLELVEWTEPLFEQGSSTAFDQLSPLNSFERFLQQTSIGYHSLQYTVGPNAQSSNAQKSVILLDELPNLHGTEAEARFRDILTAHVHRTAVPTILICSNAVEGKVPSNDIERLVDATTLYSPACRIVRINSPTAAKFGNAIKDVASKEHLKVSSKYIEELHFRCGGDLRFAITTMQFEGKGSTASKKSSLSTLRDTNIMPFHALGKLLYAKRQKVPAKDDKQRPPLEFDPEAVVEKSQMEVSGVLHFLEYHCVEFFTDVDDLAVALDHFSDAATLLDHPRQQVPSTNSIFPESYATSLAGRTVANANRHPAPTSFRSFGAPKVFDVIRKRNENASRIQHVCWARNVTQSTTSTATFALDVLPFSRTILPFHHVSSSFLDSYFAASVSSRKVEDDENETERARLEKEQAEVLKVDDIVEDVDDTW
jgi:cell cycle checkpoint protein